MKTRKKWKNAFNERGSAIIYIFAAVSLAALLIFAVTKSSTDTSPKALEVSRIEAQLRAWINVVRAEIMECVLTYPNPVDVDGDGDIDCTDNNNPPFPIAAASMAVMECPGAPTGQKAMFTGKNGRFLPDLPDSGHASAGMSNNADGTVGIALVYVSSPIEAQIIEAMQRIANGVDLTYTTYLGAPLLGIGFRVGSTPTTNSTCSTLP